MGRYFHTLWFTCIFPWIIVIKLTWHIFSSIQFSHSIMSNSLWPHGLQLARPPCPSPTHRVYSNSCPLSQWCHPTISSSVVPFSFCLQSYPASVQFNFLVMSDSLWLHGLQDAKPPWPSPIPGVYSNSCPLIRWCCTTISSTVIPFSCTHRESFQTGFDTKLLRLGDSLEELLDSGFCWWLPWTLGQNVVDSCLDIVGDLFFAVAAALVLQLSICLSTSFIEFCSQKMMAMGLMLTSCTGIEGFLGELWFSWNSILPVG